MPVAVALSQWIGLEVWECPSYRTVSLNFFASFAFKKSAPNSAFADNAATKFRIVKRVKIASLRGMGCLSRGFHPRNKCPAARLHVSLDDKYDASECTVRIMSDA